MSLPVIATPKYEMTVPSTGANITYRPYVVKEEKILLIALESESETAIENSIATLIKECVESPIDIKALTNFDIEYMFTVLRSKSVGEGIKLNLPCEKEECKETHEITIDLEKVRVDNLNTEKSNHIKINDEISIDVRWLGHADRLTQAQRNTDTEGLINTIAKSIETIYSGEEIFACKDAPFKEVVRFIESLTNDQFQVVAEYVAEQPSIGYTVEYDCKCGHHNEKELKGMQDFFI